ncbi:uncharacterized protein LOC6563974 [Drosophila grimshawi]|nr:uncharacterized protein LOC6563974 [Drosophila grimshawi]
MVKMIAAVRRNTQECRLADALFDHMQRQQMLDDNSMDQPSNSLQLVDKSTQTMATTAAATTAEQNENYTSYTLSQKIDFFQSQLAESECETQPTKLNGNEQEERPTTSMSGTEDEVAQELAKLFDDEPTDLNAIFGIDFETTATLIDTSLEPTAALEPQLMPLASPTTPPSLPHNSNTNSADLRNSRWPCELYAQRRRLSACLVRLLDTDWRCEDALRYKFRILFGEDSDDEFATHISSPSIDLVDEVLLASCILRIRPWIVRHLMRPLQEGLIANRFLFKKLAKMLANNIVLVNPYASERQIKQVVESMFCIQPRGVQNIIDLESLPPVFVERFQT